MLNLVSTVFAQNYSDSATDKAPTLQDLEVVFGNVIGVILGLAGIVLFVLLIVGGFRFITAGDDPKAVEGAKKTITYAILGVVFVALSFLVLQFIYDFTGVNITEFKIFQR